MGGKTNIEWTEATWTPIRARAWDIQNDGSGKERIGWHCEHVSEGCRNCYAERMNDRLGTGRPFKPGELRGKPGYAGGEVGRPELFLDERMLTQPLRWKRPRQIFVCSMTDLCAAFVPDEWIDRIFAVMALCPQHTFQVLTKRPERMRQYLQNDEAYLRVLGDGVARELEAAGIPWNGDWDDRHSQAIAGATRWPLPNVWLGVSVEDQKTADQRIPHLLETPAAIRWISYEPALGPVDLTRISGMCAEAWFVHDALRGRYTLGGNTADDTCSTETARIDWIVAGGESGPNARPAHPDWFRSARDQCAAAGVPFLFKQWGEWASAAYRMSDGMMVFRQFENHQHWVNKASTWVNGGVCLDKNGTPLLVGKDFGAARDEGRFPVTIMHRIGKKAAGRLLDGVLHDAYPEPR